MRASLTPAHTLIAIATATSLMVPLVAMQFTAEVDWGVEDVLAAGVLLFGAALAAMVVSQARSISRRYRIAGLLAVAALFLLAWAELAAGAVGTPVAGS